jgi:murein DD-endopeptidase MepM/ murein hydrolase activator NlpD
LVLVVVAGGLTAAAIFQRDRALEQVYENARSNAELYTATVLRSSLSPAAIATPMDEGRRSAVFAEVQGLILTTDSAVARVRIWSGDGRLVFSTDPADALGIGSQDEGVTAAFGSPVTTSRLAVDDVSPTTAIADPVATPVFQSFVPIELRGAQGPSGLAQIDQFASALEDRANDPWWIVQVAASGATVLLALLALLVVARGARRKAPAADALPRRSRRSKGWEGEVEDLRTRLQTATARAKEAESSAAGYAAQLREVSERLETVERRSPDERVAELREQLHRSEAERAMLRAGRPETVVEAELRELRSALQEARSRAKAAQALVAGKGDPSALQEQLVTAEREAERAKERARLADARADAAEEQARGTGELAAAAEQRIDLLEAKLQEVASSAMGEDRAMEIEGLRRELAAASARAEELERRVPTPGVAEAAGTSHEVLAALEERVAAAEDRAAEAERRLRAFEDEAAEESSAFRHTLGVRAAGRKLAAPEPSERAERPLDPESALRNAVARGLRGPLTRASGLTLSLQGAVDSSDGKQQLRQLSSSLRRLDQLAADLHEVRRIVDGSLPLNRRRTDLSALLTTTLEEADHLIEDRMLRLDAERVHATIDPVRFRQIVEGMLEAARDRTRAGAAIVVRARTTDRGTLVSVEDDNKKPATVGPELSLASRLAELHGTELTAEGNSFRVLLPAEEGS